MLKKLGLLAIALFYIEFAQAAFVIFGLSQSVTGTLEVPGPSAALFANPPYTCTTNVYVSPTGSSGNSGTVGSPWDIVTAFNSKNFTAGTCVNLADGVYQPSTSLQVGGNGNTTAGSSATPGGYVVFKAYQTMDGPHIEGTNITNNVLIVDSLAKYIWIDGIIWDGQATNTRATQDCIQATGNSTGNLSDGRTSHHVVLTNNILENCGQAGFQGGNTDYEWLIHNSIHNNAFNQLFVEASGISIFEPLALQGYTPTTCSTGCGTNAAMAYDSFWCGTGSSISAINVCYNIVVAFNQSYLNYNFPSAGNTDGEGYESDDWAHAQQSCSGLTPGCPYNGNGLVLGNLFYGNGGPGYEINGQGPAGMVLVMNNTATDNFFDPYNTGNCSNRGDLQDLSVMTNQFWLNNIGFSNHYTSGVGCGSGTANFAIVAGFGSGTGDTATFQTNVTYPAGQDFTGTNVTYPTTGANHNFDGSNPNFTSVSPVTGIGTANPVAGNMNFTLQPGSPAIGVGQSFSLWPQSGSIDDGAYPTH